MRCDHAAIQSIGFVTWCQRCGAIRESAHLDWHLPESEQREVRLAEMCPICEFGDPLLVEVDGEHNIRRWSCGHWTDSRHAEKLRREKEGAS
jgi:hypothetical protein